jgi:hypothetical protein
MGLHLNSESGDPPAFPLPRRGWALRSLQVSGAAGNPPGPQKNTRISKIFENFPSPTS